MPSVSGIFNYPIKGLSPQAVPSVLIEAQKPFPFDRVFALARPNSPIYPDAPRWAKKGLFVMLMFDETLAQVRTNLDAETLDFTIFEGGTASLQVNLLDPEGRAAVERFIHNLVPALKAPPRLVQARDGHFMDKPDNVVSLINLATIKSLEALWNMDLHPLRFRANFYIDGAAPWAEFDWIGSEIRLGDAVFRVDRRNGRCSATNVDPLTGKRDRDIPGSLRASFGHKDLGVYLVAEKGGWVAVGDAAHVPQAERLALSADAPGLAARDGASRYICTGCYFIYDDAAPAQGVAGPQAAFADLPAGWRCPDCGAGKEMFQPVAAPPAGAARH